MIKAVIFDWAGTTIDYGSFAPVKGFIDGFKSIGIDISSEMARKPMGLLKIDHVRAIADMLESKISEKEILEAYSVFEDTLLENIEKHCDLKDYLLETVKELRKHNIKIGSTTGYTSLMMEKVLPLAKEQGYEPDFWITPDKVTKGRPYPYMIWQNMMQFGIDNPRDVIKVGDTVADIEEGLKANCWTVGIINGSSELGLNRAEYAILTLEELKDRKEAVRATYYQTGADYIIDDLNELQSVIQEINLKLDHNKKHYLLTPGPVSTKHSVKQALLSDHCTWDMKYREITSSVIDDLTAIAANNDYATVLLPGSGTYAVEAMINSLNLPDKKILFLVNGEYGRRMVTTAHKSRKPYEVLMSKETEPVDLGALQNALETGNDIKTVMFVHCETTTGVINPLNEIVKLAKKKGKQVMVDAMSSFAGYEINMPEHDIDALAASANKCLESLPGLSFVIAKKILLEKSEEASHSHSLDLYDQYKSLYHDKGKFRFTSPTNIILSLRQAIDELKKEGGITARRKRYMKNQQILVQGLAELGIHTLVDQTHQSYIITAFELGKLDFDSLYQALKNEGFIIYPGKLLETQSFRIGSGNNLLFK